MSQPLVLIQARSGGTRLPGKIYAFLGHQTMLKHVMDRVDATGMVWDVCRPEDCPGVAEDDVLGRFHARLTMLDPTGEVYDPILRVTADCPMLDHGLVRRALAIFQDGEYDLVGTDPAWDGLDIEVMARASLDYAARTARDPREREHVTLFTRRFGRCRPIVLDGPPLRWSVDDQAGLDFVRAVFERCEHCLAGQPHRMRESKAGVRPIWDTHDVYGLHPNGAPEPMACEAFDLLEERTGGPIYVSR
jgi:spore coat polysaccharide biosynthesis protein SpsF (cytidylyltransferase family)